MKKSVFIACLILFFSGTFAQAQYLPLCSFPFGSNAGSGGGFYVQYEGRFYDPSYADQTSLPNGGIKFSLELGYYSSQSMRDSEAEKVQQLRYEKYEIKPDSSIHVVTTHILTKPGKYLFTDRIGNQSYVADYNLWLGEANNAIGKWNVYLTHTNGTYTAQFEITKEMIDSPEPIPVELKIKRDLAKNFTVCFDQSDYAIEYRVRVFNGSDFIYDSKITDLTQNPICHTLPLAYAGKSGRVEARTKPLYWITLGVPCQGPISFNGFYTFLSRACTFFTLDGD
jgi:hypothetical protein